MLIRKKLMTDVSAEQIRITTEILKSNEIVYDMKTIANRGLIGRSIDTTIGMGYQTSRTMENDGMKYIYVIYVKPRDYHRAKTLLN